MDNKKIKISLILALLFLNFFYPIYPAKAITKTIKIPFLGELQLKKSVDTNASSYTSEIVKPINFHGIHITNSQITYDSGTAEKKEPSFFINGDAKIHDITINITILIGQDEEGNTILKKVEGNLKGEDKLKPFKNFPNLPQEIKNTTIKNVKFVFDKEKNSYFEGTSTILKTDVSVKLQFEKSVMFQDITEVTLKAYIKSPSWKISDAFPQLKDKPLDELKFKGQVSFIVSSYNHKYKDPDLGIKITKGLTFLAKINLATGRLKNIKNMTTDVITEVLIYGTLSKDIDDMIFTAELNTQLKFKEGKKSPFRSVGVALELTPKSIALLGKLGLRPHGQDIDLDVALRIQLGLEAAEYSGTMEGKWENAFGIPEFAIADVAIEGETNYELLAVGIPISGLGFTGKLYVVNIEGSASFRFGAEIDDTIFAGTLKNFTLATLLAIPQKMGAKIDLEKIPTIGIKEAKIYLAPLGGQIGEIIFERGFKIKADVIILNKEGKINFTVHDKGINGEGTLSQLEIPKLFKLTGKGLDKIKGTTDDGPAVSIILIPFKQNVYLTGEVSLLGISSSATEMEVSRNKIYFKTEGKIFKLWQSVLEASTEGENLKKIEDFKIKAHLKSDFFDEISKKAIEKLEEFRVKTQKDLDQAQKDVKEKGINKIINKINEAQKKVDKIKMEINKTNKYYDNLPKGRKAIEWIWIGPKLGSLYTAFGTATGSLKAAKATLTGANLLALEALEFAEKASQNLANLGISLTKTIKKTHEIFSIKEATFEGSLKELTKSKLPRLTTKVVIEGKELLIDMQFDLKNIPGSIAKMVKSITEAFKK